MEFKYEDQAIRVYDQADKMIAEITYVQTEDPQVVIADHTFVDDSLRGQGVAGQLLDHLVERMDKEGKKIQPQCSYVVKKFADQPEKYSFIQAK